jgi:hypothetical protein
MSILELVKFEISARCGRIVVGVVLGLLLLQAKKLANPHNNPEKIAFCFKLGAPEPLVG